MASFEFSIKPNPLQLHMHETTTYSQLLHVSSITGSIADLCLSSPTRASTRIALTLLGSRAKHSTSANCRCSSSSTAPIPSRRFSPCEASHSKMYDFVHLSEVQTFIAGQARLHFLSRRVSLPVLHHSARHQTAPR